MDRALDAARNVGDEVQEVVGQVVPDERQEELRRRARGVAAEARRLVESDEVDKAFRDLGSVFRDLSGAVRRRMQPRDDE